MSDPSITDWISAVTGVVGTAGLFVGFFFAWKQLAAWKHEARETKRAFIAEDLIVAANNCSDSLKTLRSPIDTVPIEKIHDKNFALQRRFDRVVAQNDLFRTLRQTQIKASFVLQNSIVEKAVDELFKVRNKVLSGIELLADYTDATGLSQSEKDLIGDTRRDVFGSYGQIDALGQMQLNAVQVIQEQLGPLARFDPPQS